MVCERMRYVAREMRRCFGVLCTMVKERRRVRHHFNHRTLNLLRFTCLLCTVHNRKKKKNLILIVHPMPTAGKLKAE